MKIITSHSKREARELKALGWDPNSFPISINGFIIMTTAPSEAKAYDEVLTTKEFLAKGTAYISLQTLLNNFKNRLLIKEASLKYELSTAEVELDYLKKQAMNLELLQKRYPSPTGVSLQVLDFKENDAKYLPLST